jgi:hypothetical protein
MGVMARLTYASLHDASDTYTNYAPALLYTVTYHSRVQPQRAEYSGQSDAKKRA